MKIKKYIKNKFTKTELENICNRCGACCGAFDNNPCGHLKKDYNDNYYCDIYRTRFGFHKTIKGDLIMCGPIFEMIEKGSWKGDELCGYKNLLEKCKELEN